MNFRKAIDYFVPAQYANDKELSRKSRFIVWFVYITGCIGIFFSGLIYFQNPADLLNILMALIYVPLFVLALFHFRIKGSFIFTTHFICGIFTLAMCFMPGATGGIFSPDLPTVYILPIFALIMGNYRIGVFYGVLTVSVFVAYYIAGMKDSAFYKAQTEVLTADYFFFNVILNFLVISFLVFRNENLRLKLLGELKSTNLIISQKSKEITDSINYAKKIQTAILPEPATVKNHFPDSFVLYLPKDIVSGDFYWITEKHGHQYIAVADCTGHGVPGAFMSVIGVNQLNDIVLEKGISSPAQILVELDRSVNRVLKQNQNEISDGMDIAILKVDLQSKTLEYAGANRPLYYVRNKQLSVIKATKSPIGGVEVGREKNFESNHLQLQAGDMVYLSTDGYADQFGGKKDKKMTTRKFKALLESVAEQQPSGQEKSLFDAFNTFKAENEQTDDVLLAGLRF